MLYLYILTHYGYRFYTNYETPDFGQNEYKTRYR